MRRCSECSSVLYAPARPERGDLLAPRVSSPADVYGLVRRLLATQETERLIALYLDSGNRMIGRPSIVSIGSLNTTRTHPREIFRTGIVRNAAGLVIAHNHPSGSLEVSKDDRDFTGSIRRAGELIGIIMHDHLVVSRRGFVSLRELGVM